MNIKQRHEQQDDKSSKIKYCKRVNIQRGKIHVLTNFITREMHIVVSEALADDITVSHWTELKNVRKYSNAPHSTP